MFNKILVSAGLVVCLIVCNIIDASAASKLNSYQKMIQNKNFMIKYETITKTPAYYLPNQEVLNLMFDPGAMNKVKQSYDLIKNKLYFINHELFQDKIIVPQSKNRKAYESTKELLTEGVWCKANSKGVTVVSGNKVYSECINDYTGVYTYSIDNKSLEWKYIGYGEKKYFSEIEKNEYNINKLQLKYKDYDIESEMNYGINFGNVVVTRYLHAILPEEDHPMTIPVFKLIKSTDEYEEYYSDDGSLKEVVRYYFDGNNLSKIMAMAVRSNVNNSTEVGQYIININEFTDNVDTKYFTLPDYIISK